MKKSLIIGSRASKLALVQAEYIKKKLAEFFPHLDLEIKTIKTKGDKILDVALSKIGDKGLFTKELEEALLKAKIDLAVHSLKDLPTELPDGLKIAAVTVRDDPRDVLISKQGFTPLEKAIPTECRRGEYKEAAFVRERNSLTGFTINTLPKYSKIGTSSLRRRAQLLNIRQDLNILDLRGNLDTRIKKLEEGLFDAIILAYAGIIRLGFKLKFSFISVEEIIPQAGQGALAVEINEKNKEVGNLLKALDDKETHLCIDGERALLAGLEGGCQVPIGVYANIHDNDIRIKAGLFSLDGKIAIKDEIAGDKKNAEVLGHLLAEKILEKKFARQILDEIRKFEK